MVQPANSVEMLARRNCASILLAHESNALHKLPPTSGGGRSCFRHPEKPYKCKDCGRTFETFQALGGHRANHNKQDLPHQQFHSGAGIGDVKLLLPHQIYQSGAGQMKLLLPHQIYHPGGGEAVARPARMKVHECGQCQERFPSGQALGGHMRKHAELTAKRKSPDEKSVEDSEIKKKRGICQFDLNFPLAEDR